jgi:L-rhamnose mutarotase
VDIAKHFVALYPEYKNWIINIAKDKKIPVQNLDTTSSVLSMHSNSKDLHNKSKRKYIVVMSSCNVSNYSNYASKESNISHVLEVSNFNYQMEYKIKEWLKEWGHISCAEKDISISAFDDFKSAADYRDIWIGLNYQDMSISESDINYQIN